MRESCETCIFKNTDIGRNNATSGKSDGMYFFSFRRVQEYIVPKWRISNGRDQFKGAGKDQPWVGCAWKAGGWIP